MKLTTLDLASNFIPKIENVGHLAELEEFWVSLVKFDPMVESSAKWAFIIKTKAFSFMIINLVILHKRNIPGKYFIRVL